jgi:hypothetical protein
MVDVMKELEIYNENYKSFEAALITVWNIITETTSDKNDMLFEIADVYDEAQWRGLVYDSVEKAVVTLNRMGLLVQPEKGKYKRVYR